MTTEGEHSLWKGIVTIYINNARMIQTMLYGTQYLTQVSLNYMLVHVLRLVYTYVYILT